MNMYSPIPLNLKYMQNINSFDLFDSFMYDRLLRANYVKCFRLYLIHEEKNIRNKKIYASQLLNEVAVKVQGLQIRTFAMYTYSTAGEENRPHIPILNKNAPMEINENKVEMNENCNEIHEEKQKKLNFVLSSIGFKRENSVFVTLSHTVHSVHILQ